MLKGYIWLDKLKQNVINYIEFSFWTVFCCFAKCPSRPDRQRVGDLIRATFPFRQLVRRHIRRRFRCRHNGNVRCYDPKQKRIAKVWRQKLGRLQRQGLHPYFLKILNLNIDVIFLHKCVLHSTNFEDHPEYILYILWVYTFTLYPWKVEIKKNGVKEFVMTLRKA